MHIITQSCVLFLWLHMLTFVRSQDCTLQQFINGPLFDSNFDTTGLAASYAGGKQVRVSCTVGYSGFFKLICVEGKWQSRGTKCQPRSCGHPGDAQFADFHLEKGDDFVFGSQVVYTCQKGYQMVSRTNYRRCMAEGWDGMVPVCEAQQCSVIHVDKNVQVIGDPEEATYGNVVRFRCKTNSQMLIGSPEIYCDENGEWNGEPPKCQEIKCLRPEIENGLVSGDIQEYKENEVLHFTCISSYKRTEARPSKCIKQGIRADWSPTPACEPVTCTLSLPPIEGTRYEPTFRNLFSPGDTVRVICGEKYWISTHQDTSAVTTCKQDGTWSVTPICQEVLCSSRRPKHVYSWNVGWMQRMTLGERVSYWCTTGYEHTGGATMATCTRNGWEPDPLCQEKTCKRQHYDDADIDGIAQDEYKFNDKVNYVCKAGYEGRFTLTCGERGWTGSERCTRVPCKKLHIDNARITYNEKENYRLYEQVQYACRNEERVFTVTCQQDGWTGIESCSGTTCSAPRIPHGFAVGPYNDTLFYTCREGYKLLNKGWWALAKCNDGVWSGLQQCVENTTCGEVPVIANGKVKPSRQSGSAQIICDEGYQTEVNSLTCHEGKWLSDGLSPETICRTPADPCSPPAKVENAVIVTPYHKEYLSGSTVTFLCRDKYTVMLGKDTIYCQDGKWKETENIKCIPFCDKLKDLTMNFTTDKERYMDGDVIKYQCLTSDVEGVATCVNTKWNKSQECEACSTLPDVPHAYVSEETKRAEYQEGNVIHFTCETGYISGPTIRYICSSSSWVPVHRGRCYLKPCQLPDDTPNGYYQIIEGEEFVFGTKIKYFCDKGYQMVSKEDTRTCLLEKWTNHVPICEPLSCDAPPANAGVTVEGLPENDDLILADRFLTFSCDDPGKHLNGSSVLVCGRDGQWNNPFPSCEEIICEVGTVPPHLNIVGLPPGTETMKIGHKLRFLCDDQYTIEGSEEVQCLETGKWNAMFPTCAEQCKVTGVPDGVRLKTRVRNNQVRIGQKLRFECTNYRDTLRGNSEVECLADGQWSDPFPTCGDPLECGKPPFLADGDTKLTVRFKYRHGQRVEYICQNYYTMEGEPYKTCKNGDWIGEMKCLKPCTVDREAMDTHNIAFKHRYDDKLYSAHNDEIHFRCTRRMLPVDPNGMRQRCVDGVMHLPSCQ